MLLLVFDLLLILLRSANLLPLRSRGLAQIQICLGALLGWFLHTDRNLS